MRADYVAHSGDDLLVVNAARTSFAKEKQEFDEKDAKLIAFLAREKHLLPFRHPTLTLRCKAPMFVARQLGKHQAGMSWSEESRRYINTEPEFYWPNKWRKKAENVKQGSSDEVITELPPVACFDDPLAKTPWKMSNVQHIVKNSALSMYNRMLEAGIAPEQARMVLPQNMYINWVWTGTLLAWIHMIQQRTDSHTQQETQQFARLVESQVRKLYPVSAAALLDSTS